jgi:hypothetical protein
MEWAKGQTTFKLSHSILWGHFPPSEDGLGGIPILNIGM